MLPSWKRRQNKVTQLETPANYCFTAVPAGNYCKLLFYSCPFWEVLQTIVLQLSLLGTPANYCFRAVPAGNSCKLLFYSCPGWERLQTIVLQLGTPANLSSTAVSAGYYCKHSSTARDPCKLLFHSCPSWVLLQPLLIHCTRPGTVEKQGPTAVPAKNYYKTCFHSCPSRGCFNHRYCTTHVSNFGVWWRKLKEERRSLKAQCLNTFCPTVCGSPCWVISPQLLLSKCHPDVAAKYIKIQCLEYVLLFLESGGEFFLVY